MIETDRIDVRPTGFLPGIVPFRTLGVAVNTNTGSGLVGGVPIR